MSPETARVMEFEVWRLGDLDTRKEIWMESEGWEIEPRTSFDAQILDL